MLALLQPQQAMGHGACAGDSVSEAQLSETELDWAAVWGTACVGDCMHTLAGPGRFTSSARRTGPLSVRRSPPERGPFSSHSLDVPFAGESRLLVRFGMVCPTSRLLKVYLSSSPSLHSSFLRTETMSPYRAHKRAGTLTATWHQDLDRQAGMQNYRVVDRR